MSPHHRPVLSRPEGVRRDAGAYELVGGAPLPSPDRRPRIDVPMLLLTLPLALLAGALGRRAR